MKSRLQNSANADFVRLRLSFAAALLAFFAFVPAASSVRPQDAPGTQEPTARLEHVSATGSKRFLSDRIIAATGLKTGASVGRADLQKAADLLSQLGIFSNVQYRFTSPESGLQVEFVVADSPGLPICFDNFPWVSDEDLSGAIKAAVPLFEGMAPAAGTILDSMDSAIELFLEKEGVFAKISHAKMTDPLTDEPELTFAAAGPAQDVKSIEFSDPIAANDRGVHERLADLIGKPYSRTALELFEVEQIRPAYFRRGLLKVHFGAPEIQAEKASGEASLSRVTVRVAVDPGAAYSWSGATWTGNAALSSAELNGFVSLKAGDLADGTKVAGLWNHIADEYGHRGYLDAKVDPKPEFDEKSKHVSYTVAINEGPQYHMGSLVLSGLSVAGEQRVREAWSLKPGAVFDETFFNEFIETGAKNSFVGIPYTYQKVGRYLEKNPAAGKVDVMIDFQ